MEVYGDLYILVNGGMDYLCLLLTAMLLHRKPMRSRLFFAAALGGSYALLSLLLSPGGVFGVLLDLLALLPVCALGLYEKGMGKGLFAESLLLFGGVSVLLGGVMTVLFEFLNRLDLPLELLKGGDGLSVWIFLLVAALGGLLTLWSGKALKKRSRQESGTLELECLGKKLTLSCMVDSGNLLKDPISGRGVIVADEEKFREVLPKSFFEKGMDGDLCTETLKIRLIPARTASGTALFKAFLPTSLTVHRGGTVCSGDYLIAPVKLGKEADGFDALLPME